MEIVIVLRNDRGASVAEMPEKVLREVFKAYDEKLEKPLDKALYDLKNSLRKL